MGPWGAGGNISFAVTWYQHFAFVCNHNNSPSHWLENQQARFLSVVETHRVQSSDSTLVMGINWLKLRSTINCFWNIVNHWRGCDVRSYQSLKFFLLRFRVFFDGKLFPNLIPYLIPSSHVLSCLLCILPGGNTFSSHQTWDYKFESFARAARIWQTAAVAWFLSTWLSL